MRCVGTVPVNPTRSPLSSGASSPRKPLKSSPINTFPSIILSFMMATLEMDKLFACDWMHYCVWTALILCTKWWNLWSMAVFMVAANSNGFNLSFHFVKVWTRFSIELITSFAFCSCVFSLDLLNYCSSVPIVCKPSDFGYICSQFAYSFEQVKYCVSWIAFHSA